MDQLYKLIDLTSMLIIGELLLIAIRKLIHVLRIVIPPRPKLRTGRNIVDPIIYLRPLFAYPSWPYPIDQDSLAIGVIYVVINSFDHNLSATHIGRLRLSA